MHECPLQAVAQGFSLRQQKLALQMRLPAREADSSDLFNQATVVCLSLIPAHCISSRAASCLQSASCGQDFAHSATAQTE